MIIGVDIGATKTLVASFDTLGQVVAERKIPTVSSPSKFSEELISIVQDFSQGEQIEHLVVASRGEIDVDSLSITDHKKLGWDKFPLGAQLKAELKPRNLKFIHDTHAAALYEAKSGAGKGFKTMLYITLSTGIGTALTVDGRIVDFMLKTGGGDMVVGMSELDSDAVKNVWENRVSGTAIKARFGREPHELVDSNEWKIISKELALGINNCVVLIQPDVVVIGGGVANNFDKFSVALIETLTNHTTSQYPLMPILQASDVDRAVVLGTYNLVSG